jgi:peptidyl-prolyl cis-trans isomerase A (cyclophilin A)
MLSTFALALALGAAPAAKPSRVLIATDLGDIEVHLAADAAPNTVANFLKYVEAKRYDGGRFHRTVTPDNQPQNKVKIEVIQAGPKSDEKSDVPIKLERTKDTKLRHVEGTISMARDGPDTATADFFICIGDQPELDFGGKRNPDGQGFAAFGQVVKGMDVVKKIQQSKAEGQTLKPAVTIRNIRVLPPKKLLLISTAADGHPPGTHEYHAGVRILQQCLERVPGVEVTLAQADGVWKDGPELIGRSDGVFLFVSEGAKWLSADAARLAAFRDLAKRGGAFGVLHWGMGTKDAENIEAFANLFGGCHGGPDRKYQVLEKVAVSVADVKHPAAAGIKDFIIREEFYYKLKLPKGDVKPLLTAKIDGADETVAWTWQRPDRGRSFGFTGLHFHENWSREEYRRLVTQGMIWALGLSVPPGGLDVTLPAATLELDEAGFKPLFNGKNLDGWQAFSRETKDAPTKSVQAAPTWTVDADSVLKCVGKPTGYLATKAEHADYVLRLQWRYPKELKAGNSGVLVHCQKNDIVWPVCVEAQLRSGRAGDIWLQTAADVKLTVPAGRRDADDKTMRHIWREPKDGVVERPFGEWNDMEIACTGGSIAVRVNGKLVNAGTDCNLTKGRIALQSEGTEIHFRNIRIKSQ